jgi:hypothetical protein
MPHADPAIRKEYMRQWRELHAAEIKAEKALYRQANRKRMNANDRARYLRNCGRSPDDETDYRWKIPPEKVSEIVERYISGETRQCLAKSFRITPVAICHHLKRQGIALRVEEKRELLCDDAAFDEITDASAYWAGFLITDGCVHRNTVIINVGAKDREHLERFRSFLKADAKVKIITMPERRGHVRSKGQIANIRVNSPRICNALAKIGITPRKTFTAKACEQLENNRHFWRGVIDGDGAVCFDRSRPRPYPILSLCGASLELMSQFAEYCEKLLGRTVRVGSRRNGRHFVVQVSGTFAVKVIDNLYSGSIDHLERKKANAVAASQHTFKKNGGRHSLVGYRQFSYGPATQTDPYENQPLKGQG